MVASSSSSSPRPPPWVILDRVALVWYDDVEDPEDVSVALAAPPRVSTLTVPTSIHPDPSEHDKHPYVVAADHAGLLLHLYRAPFVGFDLAPNPEGIFVLVRDFLPVAASKLDEPTGTAVRVPDRAQQPEMPRVSNIKNVGLVSIPGSGGADYIVAELVKGADRATLLYFRSGTPAWVEKDLACPEMPGLAGNVWASHDVISHDGKLWWVSLVWGILSCDPFDDHPVLLYVDLPEAVSSAYQHHWPQDIERSRCVRVSKGKLRYVEITRAEIDPLDATMVVMWTLIAGPDGLTWWKHQYGTMLEQIWTNDSYRATGMPQEVPVLAVVHPSNPDVIYFFLRQHLFGVNVPESRVVEFIDEPYGLVDVVAGTRPPRPLSWRFVLAWELPPALSRELENFLVKKKEPEDQDVAPAAEGCASSASEPSPHVSDKNEGV